MPATTEQSWIADDLRDIAALITRQGLHGRADTHASLTDGGSVNAKGPLSPIAAAWLVGQPKRLTFEWASNLAGCAELVAEQVATEPRVQAVIEHLSRHVESGIDPADPIARVADWASRTPAVEVVGRMVRLADHLAQPTAA